MKLINEWEMSQWVFWQCRIWKNDTKAIRDLITDPYWVWSYCSEIKEIPEMTIKLKNSRYKNYLKEKI